MSGDDDHPGGQDRPHDSFDEEAPELLEKLKRYVFRLRGISKVEAEDIVQTSFRKLLERMAHTVIRNKYAYLVAIALNERNDLWSRKKGKEGAVSYDNEQDEKTLKEVERQTASDDDPDTALYYRELIEAIPAAVWAGLDKDDIELIKNHAVEGATIKELAEELQKSEGDVRYHLQRLYARLRYRLRKYFIGKDGEGPF